MRSLAAPVTWGLALLALLPAGSARADGPAPGPAATLEARVSRAIDVGVVWLRARPRVDGTFPIGVPERTLGGQGPADDLSSRWAGGPWEKGADALAVYTLAACDVPREESVLVGGFKLIRAHWEGRSRAESNGISTYFVSLCLLALDAACERTTSEPLNATAEERSKARQHVPLRTTDRAWAVDLVEWLRRGQDPAENAPAPLRGKDSREPGQNGGGFGYQSPASRDGYHDHSNTQFAVLGLKAAARLGISVPEDVWERVLRHMLAVQEPKGPAVPRVAVPGAGIAQITPGEGQPKPIAPSEIKDRARGWRYLCARFPTPGSEGRTQVIGEPTLSMTAGGASTLVIARSELLSSRRLSGDLRSLTEQGIRDAFAWLASHLPARNEETARVEGALPAGVADTFGDALDDFYLLYGLERACVLGGVRNLAGLDWYRVGAERILARQQEDGSFHSKNVNDANGRPLIDTCFALLFLKRALLRIPDRTTITESSDLGDPPAPTGPPR